MDTQELLQKATMVVADLSSGGLLNPKQANRFIDMLIEDTVISREARIERMNTPKQEFNKLGFQSRIMSPAVEADAFSGETNPTTDKVELSTVEGIAAVRIGYSTLEDNIERGQLADHIVRLMAERAGLDLEEQWINGQFTGRYAEPDAWLDQNAGLFSLATAHAAPMAASDKTDVVAAADQAFIALPGKYVRNKREWRFYVHPDAEYQLRQQLSERATGAGDKYLLEDAPVLVRGIPVTPVPMFKTGDNDEGGAGTGVGSDLMLVHPKNIVIGIQRAISIESDRIIRARAVDYVATVRSDVEFEEVDAVSVVTGLEHA